MSLVCISELQSGILDLGCYRLSALGVGIAAGGGGGLLGFNFACGPSIELLRLSWQKGFLEFRFLWSTP